MSKNRPKVKQCKRCYAHYTVSPTLQANGVLMVQSPLCPHPWEVEGA